MWKARWVSRDAEHRKALWREVNYVWGLLLWIKQIEEERFGEKSSLRLLTHMSAF